MTIRFTKMHGAGNDFVVIDAVTQRLQLRPRDIRRIADRRLGIGCDQVLIVEPPGRPDADFRYRIFNADGSEAGQCGNGARCFARFIRQRRLSGQRRLVLEVGDRLLTVEALESGELQVNMGAPEFAPAAVPLRREREERLYRLVLDAREVEVGALSIGNPHAVVNVDDLDSGVVEQLGPALTAHPDFPEQVNAGFMQVLERDRIRLRVHERGAGETPACGSGACAAVVHGQRMGWLDTRVTVELPGGKLEVHWPGEGGVLLSGPTAISFEGSIRL
jgi:diaminopimelate epimerase